MTHGEVLARFGAALSDPTRSRVLLAHLTSLVWGW
jgi:hypothetical protein